MLTQHDYGSVWTVEGISYAYVYVGSRYKEFLENLETKVRISKEELDKQPIQESDKSKNVLELFLDKHSKLYSNTRVERFYLTTFKSDGNISLSWIVVEHNYSVKHDRVFVSKRDMFNLRIDVSTSRPTLVKNGKLCYTNRDLNEAFFLLQSAITTHRLTPGINKIISFLDKCLTIKNINLTKAYRLRRNVNLKDLPWELKDLKHLYDSSLLKPQLNARANMNRHLRNGNTTKATDALFYGIKFPKALRKLLIELGPLTYSKQRYLDIKSMLDFQSVNNIVNLYNQMKGDRVGRDKLLFPHLYFIITMDYFSYQHIMNTLKKRDGIKLLYDTTRMSQYLGISPPRPNMTIQDFHNDLIRIQNENYVREEAVRQSRRDNYVSLEPLLESTDISLTNYHYEDVDYKIVTPKYATDLKAVGNTMSICVGIYAESVFKRERDIVLVLDIEGKPIACLELRNGSIVQAKLSYNRPVREDKVLLNLICVWAKKQSLNLQTYDISNTLVGYTDEQCPDKGRLDLIEGYTKSQRKLRGLKEPESDSRYLDTNDQIPFQFPYL